MVSFDFGFGNIVEQSFDLSLAKKPFAQGTTEYLVVIAVVVVISLIVVGLLINQTDSAQNISSSVSKVSQSSGMISISETVIDVDGNGLITLTNNSGGSVSITKISVDGSDSFYSSVSLFQGEEKVFSLGDIGSSCSCVGFEGKTKPCEVIIEMVSDYGLEKQFTASMNVDCVPSAIAVASSAIVQPVSYEITLNLKDSFSESDLLEFSMDCNSNNYDLSSLDSPVLISFKEGSYSCVFSKNGYDSNTITIISDDTKSVEILLDSIDVVHFSDCGTLSITDGNYILDEDIGSGGACLTIAADNISIKGNDYTITGDVNASKSGARAYTGLKINDTRVVGVVAAVGSNSATNPAFNGGTITLTNSYVTTIDANGGRITATVQGNGGNGGNVMITDSVVEKINASGGSTWYNTSYGGVGGTVTIMDSNVVTITTIGGFSTYSGNGGVVSITDSNVTSVITTGGGGTSSVARSGEGGAVTISNSLVGTIMANGGALGYFNAKKGGAVTVTNGSIINTINTTGGNGGQGYPTYGAAGGAGGAISVTDSNVDTLIAKGGNAGRGHNAGGAGGNVTLTNSNFLTVDASGGVGATIVDYTAAGGAGGTVSVTDSNMSSIASTGGTSLATGGIGGSVTFNVCPEPVPTVTVTGGSGSPAGLDGSINPDTCHDP
ncbi:MAG: hypothetical protein WC462_03565 [archaeon]